MKYRRYAAYKESGVEWLGEVPAHWEVKRLRMLADINPSKSEVAVLPPNTEVTFLPMESISEQGVLDLSQNRPLASVYQGFTYFCDEDVVTAKITPCFENGKGALARGLTNGIAFGTTELHVLRAQNGCLPEFLWWVTRGSLFRELGVLEMKGAAGQQRVPQSFVENFPQPTPPEEEQAAIAAFLDRETAQIDALIARQERLLAVLQEKRQALIDHIVTGCPEDKETNLKYHVNLLTGYAFPSTSFSADTNDMRLLRGVNVSPGAIRWDDTVYWTDADNQELKRYFLEVGDLVFGMDRPWISDGIRVAEVTPDDTPALLLQRVARMRAQSGLSQQYLRLILESYAFRAYFEPIFTGVSVPHVSAEQILAFGFRLPSLTAQAKVCQRFKEEAHKQTQLITQLETSNVRLQERRAALISAAVTGKIDVRGGAGRALPEGLDTEIGATR